MTAFWSSPSFAQTSTKQDSALRSVLENCNHCYELSIVQDSVIEKITASNVKLEEKIKLNRLWGRVEGIVVTTLVFIGSRWAWKVTR